MGIVVSALEVVEAVFGIVDIAPVAQGIVGAQGASHGTGGAENVAPGIVGVGDHSRSGGVQDGGDIALEVGGIVVSGAVVGDGQRGAAGLIGKGQGVAAHGHLTQLAAIVDIAVRGAAVGPFGPHAVGIVGEGPGLPGKLDLAGLGIDDMAGTVGDFAAVAVSAVAVRYRYLHRIGTIALGLPANDYFKSVHELLTLKTKLCLIGLIADRNLIRKYFYFAVKYRYIFPLASGFYYIAYF